MQYRNKRTSNLQPVSLISVFKKKKKKKREKKSCSKTVKLYFYYSTQKYGDSVTKYFAFCKRESPWKIECCVYIKCTGNFQEVYVILLFANLKLISAF